VAGATALPKDTRLRVAFDVGKDDLLPGVERVLSAMTLHALLQQQGYTLNPF